MTSSQQMKTTNGHLKQKEISENKVTGDLTIKGETHEETFDVEFNGISKIQ